MSANINAGFLDILDDLDGVDPLLLLFGLLFIAFVLAACVVAATWSHRDAALRMRP